MSKKNFFADRTEGIPFSGTLKIEKRISEMRQSGIDVITFMKKADTPQHVKDAAKKFLDSPRAASYTDVAGLLELREAIAEKLERENAIDADPLSEIMVTVGGKQAIFTATLATINPGDEVLIQDPTWVSYQQCVRLAGGVPVPVPLLEEEDYRTSHKLIERSITPKTKMIVICSPNNPTGSMLDKEDCEHIADIARRNDLLILTDESYENFVYDGSKHYSVASFSDMKERTITVHSTSKIYHMPGWRIGWVTANKEIMRRMLAIQSQTITCPTSFAQAGAVAALSKPLGLGDMPINEVVRQYEEKRNVMVNALNKIPGISCVVPRGGFMAFPNVSKLGMSSLETCEFLLEKAKVATTPGIVFGRQGEGHLRFIYSSPIEEIEKGLDRVRIALEGISHKLETHAAV